MAGLTIFFFFIRSPSVSPSLYFIQISSILYLPFFHFSFSVSFVYVDSNAVYTAGQMFGSTSRIEITTFLYKSLKTFVYLSEYYVCCQSSDQHCHCHCPFVGHFFLNTLLFLSIIFLSLLSSFKKTFPFCRFLL